MVNVNHAIIQLLGYMTHKVGGMVMKKLIIKEVAALLVMDGFKIVVVELDKLHTFEVTIPAFTDTVEFFDTISNKTEELARAFEVIPQNPSE